MNERRKGRPLYTRDWTEDMEQDFEADREHGRGNIAMMEQLPTLVMNQVRLSCRSATSPPCATITAQNAHFGYHLKNTINAYMKYKFTDEECRRREDIHFHTGLIVPGVCRSITDPSTGPCRYGDDCKFLHVQRRPRG